MSVKIGFVDELDVNSILVREFYANNWKRKIALSDKTFYEWQFKHAPSNYGKDHCVIAYDNEKRKILGVMGLNERVFYLNNQQKKGAELTTWIVSEEAIGTGLGSKILSYIQSKFDILIGMGISEMALPLYMKSGFRYLKSIPRFVKVINYDKIKEHCQHNDLGIKLIKSWEAKDSKDYIASEIDDENYQQIFEAIKKKYNLYSRDVTHRKWRYELHPYFKYKQFFVKNLEATTESFAYVSFREENSLADMKILHVMDCLGDDIVMDSCIQFIQGYALQYSFDVIDFYCTSSNVYRYMLSNGWFSINDDTCFQFPHLFHPIEMRNPPTTSLIYWSKNGLSEIADLSKLYITKQDADLDRPIL